MLMGAGAGSLLFPSVGLVSRLSGPPREYDACTPAILRDGRPFLDVEDSRQIATFNGSEWSAWLPGPPFGPTIEGEPSLTTAEDDLFLTSQDWDSAVVRVERVRD